MRTEQEQESAAPSREGEARPAEGKASHARPTLAPLAPASQDIAEAQGRLGQPDDIAKASPHPAGPALSRYSCVAAICRASRPLPVACQVARFLLSDVASFVTGSHVFADGGFSAV